MQISSNHSIPGAICYPFILSEHYPFSSPQKTGGNDPEKPNWTNDSLVLATQGRHYHNTSASAFSLLWAWTFNHSSNHNKPRPSFSFNAWIHWPVIWLPHWPLLLALAKQSTGLLCVHMAPHFTNDPCLVLQDWAHSLPWKFLSLHQSSGHDSDKG